MRKIFQYVYLLPLFLVVSCTFSEGLSLDEVLKVSNTTFEFDKSATSQTLEIESYCSWDLKCDADWVTFSVTKRGEGKVKNILSVIENKSPIARSAVAEIYNEDYGVSVKINITQGASTPYIECSKDTISVSYINKTEKIEVGSNIPWEASTDAEWIEISPKSGLSGVTTMTINVNKNTSLESRSSVIRIVNSEYGIEEEILVVQSELVPDLEVNREKIEGISFDGSTEQITIESNISWEAFVDVDWIEIRPKSGLSGVTTMTINVNKNTSVDSRSSIIKIVNSEYDIEQEILVVQSAFVPELKVYREKIENISYNGSTKEIKIESNISWEASVDVDWISISPKSGLSGVTTMTINVNKNTSVESRSSVIRIVNSEYDIEQEILVVQSEFVPMLEVDREKLENISYNGSTGKIRIESNISWEASFDVDWIEISPKSGLSGVTTMTINVNKNTSLDSRSSVIRIVNSEYNIEQEILVTQSEWVPELKVNVEKLENISYNGSIEEIRIESNISWEASLDVDWIEISPKSGLSGVTTMTININKNTSVESREGIITLKNQEYSLTTEVIIQQQLLPIINGYEYVDLGLPSGLKWATCNVGASSAEEYGDYYAWGEIETKSEYDESNSKTYGKSMSDISGNSTCDVARAKWGGSWRMPTKEECRELILECKWQWTTQNGKNGYKVTGPNGNSIFLPAAGYRVGSSLYDAGKHGWYWSSTPYESNDYEAYYLRFYSSNHNVYPYYRHHGRSVRPVSE